MGFILLISSFNNALIVCSILVIILGLVNNKKNKNYIQLLLLLTSFVMRISCYINKNNADLLTYGSYNVFFAISTLNVITLLVIFNMDNDKKINSKEKIIIGVDYLFCLISFNLIIFRIDNFLIDILSISILVLNIIYFFRKCSTIIQPLSVFYIINLVILIQRGRVDILIYSNSIFNFIANMFIFIKLYNVYVKYPYNKYLKLISNINRNNINIKLYDEKLNACKMQNKIIRDDLCNKENNLHIILGQFKKSALLIDEDGYIINQDIVFQNMFEQYKKSNQSIFLDDFLNENIVEYKQFIESIEKVKYMQDTVYTKITGKDGRIFEAIFTNYDEESKHVICILSDISYENKLISKIEESDVKYKKIAKNIPYSIILEKNKEIIYNNNNLNIDLKSIKNIILNNSTKGELNYIDYNGNEIVLFIDRIEFMEGDDKLSLIEIKDMTNYKRVLMNLEMITKEYTTLIDTIPESICVFDYESKEFEYANNTFYRLFKIQDVESIDFDEIYNDISISSGNINESIKYIRKTLKDSYGGVINIESSIVLIEIDRATKMVLIMRDITEEIKVESMKKEIEESILINKDIDDFFINMSHELLTPVNLLKTSNQFIERMCRGVIEREPNGEFSNCISIVSKHVDILATLIDKIMELSRLENNYHRDSKDIYDIVSIFEDIVMEVNKHTKYKGINIVFDTDNEEVFCEIDPNNIGKAVLTLLSYVVKSSRMKSTIYFTIKTRGNKSIITIENIRRYDWKNNLEKYEEKILQLSMSIAQLIINLYKGKVSIENKDDDSICIEIELNVEQSTNGLNITDKGIDEEFILNEYKKLCNL